MAECKLRDLIALPIVFMALLLVWLGFTIGSQWIKDICGKVIIKAIGDLELERKTEQ